MLEQREDPVSLAISQGFVDPNPRPVRVTIVSVVCFLMGAVSIFTGLLAHMLFPELIAAGERESFGMSNPIMPVFYGMEFEALTARYLRAGWYLLLAAGSVSAGMLMMSGRTVGPWLALFVAAVYLSHDLVSAEAIEVFRRTDPEVLKWYAALEAKDLSEDPVTAQMLYTRTAIEGAAIALALILVFTARDWFKGAKVER